MAHIYHNYEHLVCNLFKRKSKQGIKKSSNGKLEKNTKCKHIVETNALKINFIQTNYRWHIWNIVDKFPTVTKKPSLPRLQENIPSKSVISLANPAENILKDKVQTLLMNTLNVDTVNTLRHAFSEYYQKSEALVLIDTPLTMLHRYISQQQEIGNLLKSSSTKVLHTYNTCNWIR